MSNHLSKQTSPYLLQHAENPVHWYPWCEEAFEKAKKEDKPIFLSIGYSTCHWCHVMAHESFEDAEIAELLNQHFISIKVDKEERPDVDSVYMAVCQAFTGNSGWPMSIFMTGEQKPFFAGTYFPKTSRYGRPGFRELLLAVNQKWHSDRDALLDSADRLIAALSQTASTPADAEESLLTEALSLYRESYDSQYGGFGDAPKFPTPHNLLFLMQMYEKHGEKDALEMAETTLRQMYRGGIFDHIGYGFCRYSTDRYFLVPHFEKMLYDNALLIQAYAKAFAITKNPLYLDVAEKTASYILREMQGEEGAFYSAQDADSEGEEGRYYTFTPKEIETLLGDRDAKAFLAYFNITEKGNFEGKSIPNLLYTDVLSDTFEKYLPRLRAYRKERTQLHTDDKILTTWNCLMIAGLCSLYRVSRKKEYLTAAKDALDFIRKNLREGDLLYVSYRKDTKNNKGFLEEYASYVYALLALYDVTLKKQYLEDASTMAAKAILDFFDGEKGGFYLYGTENETLITRPKESYDGAIPSGNSLMAYNLVRLHLLLPDAQTEPIMAKQMRYMAGEAKRYPAGFAMYLTALSDLLSPPMMITVVKGADAIDDLPFLTAPATLLRVLDTPTDAYQTINGQTAFYVCKGNTCLPPMTKKEFLAQL